MKPADFAAVAWRHLKEDLAARLARDAAGSGLSAGAVRVSATAVRALPLPSDTGAWREGTDLAAGLGLDEEGRRDEILHRFGEVMVRAYGPADPDLLAGWWPRATGRRAGGADGRIRDTG